MSRKVAVLLSTLALATGCGESTDSAADGGVDAGPATPKLFINEVMPSNATACADEAGKFGDWIELFNAGSADIDLNGWFISDDATAPTKRKFGTGLVVKAGGYLLLWADDTSAGAANHLSFKLSAEGEAVVLSNPQQVVVDQMTWTNATENVSLARLPDGTGAFASCTKSTCGKANGATCAP